MPSESNAIRDLLEDLTRKPVPQDPDDEVLFPGSRTAPRHARGTQPPPVGLFDMPPPAPVVPLPQPFAKMPAHALDPSLATMRVGKAPRKGLRKPFALLLVLGAVAAAAVGVYIGVYGVGPAPAAAVAREAASITPPALPPVERAQEPPSTQVQPVTPPTASAPTAAPIEAASPTATPIEPASPTVTPIEPASPTVTPIESASPTVTPIEPASPTVTPIENAAEAPADDESSAAVPASAFIADAQQPTVPTVPTAARTAPTPVAVAETTPQAEKATPAPATAKPAKLKKKSRREMLREKRAAKRALKRGKRTTTQKSVARAVTAKRGAPGMLSITSAQPREVWVDGRNSKRMTPLRVRLLPGKHKVTLFDKKTGRAKTYQVAIEPGKTARLSK